MIIQALIALAPLIGRLLDEWIKTPKEKRKDLADKLNKAFGDLETSSDTSAIENILGKI